MNPVREDTHATLVDLLDRVLDKGLIVDADLIIQVAGIPLLGVKLRAALAGMETMLEYGMWQDWDRALRASAAREYRQKLSPEGEIATFATNVKALKSNAAMTGVNIDLK